MSKDEFLGDLKTQVAVAMTLLLVGEAATQIAAHSPDFIGAHPDWPWREMRGLRNRVAHAYRTLDLDVIWIAATKSFPALLEKMDVSSSQRG